MDYIIEDNHIDDEGLERCLESARIYDKRLSTKELILNKLNVEFSPDDLKDMCLILSSKIYIDNICYILQVNEEAPAPWIFKDPNVGEDSIIALDKKHFDLKNQEIPLMKTMHPIREEIDL